MADFEHFDTVLPYWTDADERARIAANEEVQQELGHYPDDEVLLDGNTVRTHREHLAGKQAAAELVTV